MPFPLYWIISQIKINLYENIVNSKANSSLETLLLILEKSVSTRLMKETSQDLCPFWRLPRNFSSLKQLPGHLLVVDQCIPGNRGRKKLQPQRVSGQKACSQNLSIMLEVLLKHPVFRNKPNPTSTCYFFPNTI